MNVATQTLDVNVFEKRKQIIAERPRILTICLSAWFSLDIDLTLKHFFWKEKKCWAYAGRTWTSPSPYLFVLQIEHIDVCWGSKSNHALLCSKTSKTTTLAYLPQCIIFWLRSLFWNNTARVCIVFGRDLYSETKTATLCIVFGRDLYSETKTAMVCIVFGRDLYTETKTARVCIVFGRDLYAETKTDLYAETKTARVCIVFGRDLYAETKTA